MAKTTSRTHKKPARSRTRDKHLKRFLIGLNLLFVAVVTSALIVLAAFVKLYWEENANQNRATFNQLIANTIRSSYNDIVVDAPTSRVFIPELRLSAPLDAISRPLVYSVYAMRAGNNLDIENFELGISTTSVVNGPAHATGFEPRCTLLFQMQTEQKSIENFTEVSAVTLNDGRDIYIYENTSPECEIMYDGIDMQAISQVLAGLQSY